MTEFIVGGAVALMAALLIVLPKRLKLRDEKKEASKFAETEWHQKVRMAAGKAEWQDGWPDPVQIWKLSQNLPEQQRGSPAILRESIITELKLSRPEANRVLQSFRRLLVALPENKSSGQKKKK